MLKGADQFAEVVDKLRRRTEVYHPESDISADDAEYFLILQVVRQELLEDLLPEQTHRSSWLRMLMTEKKINIKQFFEDFKTAKRILLRMVDSGETPVSTSTFHRVLGSRIQYKWIQHAIRLFPDIDDPVGFSRLNQWLSFDEKATFRSIDYRTTMCDDFVTFEYEAKDWRYPDLSEYARIMEVWLDGFEPSLTFEPQHGPGAIAETQGRPSPVEKCFHFRYDSGLAELYRDILWQGDDPECWFYKPSLQTTDKWRTSQYICVPKTALSNRGISKEPCSLQWTQQGIAKPLMRFVNSSSIPIDFRDQSLSQCLCLRGSETGRFGTIDLSMASDSITAHLFKEFFKKTTLYWPGLLSRSKYTSVKYPDGTVVNVELAKMSPMGSGLCFPIESLVFSAICESVAANLFGHRYPRQDLYRVYGDDIIVRQEMYDPVIEKLQELHFLPNEDKSFNGMGPLRFREACGVEALNGADVTPFRISRGLFLSFDSSKISSPDRVVSIVESCNNAGLHGLRRTQKALTMMLKPFIGSSSIRRVATSDWLDRGDLVIPSLLTTDVAATNYRVKSRYNRLLWRGELRTAVACAQPRSSNDSSLQDAAYWLWFWENEGPRELLPPRDLREGRGTSFGSTPARWCRKWVPD